MKEHPNTSSGQETSIGILDLLAEQYENSPDGDSFLSNVIFHELYKELRPLDPDGTEHVISLACMLCSEYSRSGYIAGVKDGAHLIMELNHN